MGVYQKYPLPPPILVAWYEQVNWDQQLQWQTSSVHTLKNALLGGFRLQEVIGKKEKTRVKYFFAILQDGHDENLNARRIHILI